jgi:hypothetical protein
MKKGNHLRGFLFLINKRFDIILIISCFAIKTRKQHNTKKLTYHLVLFSVLEL